jgi:hypothetical protein
LSAETLLTLQLLLFSSCYLLQSSAGLVTDTAAAIAVISIIILMYMLHAVRQ